MENIRIESFLPVFPGFYGTIFEPDEDNEINYVNDERESKGWSPLDFDKFEFDYDHYHTEIAKESVNWVENIVNGIFKNKIQVNFESIQSPKYYNFSNDSINVNYVVNEEFLKEMMGYLNTNKEEFAHYIKENYTSRDGFFSHYSNDVDEWLNEYFLDIETNKHYFGSILEFVINNEIDDPVYEMKMDCETQLFCSNYNELIENETI